MSYPILLGERKFKVGADQKFIWTAPEPIYTTVGPPVVVPSLSVKMPSGAVSVALTKIHADITVDVAGLASDMKTLTITAPANTSGLQGRYGSAWLITSDESVYPIQIIRISGTSLIVAEQFTRKLDLSSGGTIQFATWTGTLPVLTITTSILRNVQWVLTYQAQYGSDTPVLGDRVDEGLLHIVATPFSTGLTSTMLSTSTLALQENIPRSQSDWEPQINAASEELILDIRAQLLSRGLNEDNIPSGELLRMAHISYCLAHILDYRNPELADRYRLQASSRIKLALRSIWVDADGDGVVDPGETNVQITGAKITDISPSISTTTFPSPVWTVDYSH